jgi:hypothetical protein
VVVYTAAYRGLRFPREESSLPVVARSPVRIARQDNTFSFHNPGALFPVLLAPVSRTSFLLPPRPRSPLLPRAHDTVTSASSGQEALALLHAGTQFNLLLTDVMMPDVDGPTLLHYVRNDPIYEAGPPSSHCLPSHPTCTPLPPLPPA